MGKILKPMKGVIMLNGKYAGKKGIILKLHEDPTDAVHPYGCALVAGIKKCPLRVTKKMPMTKIRRRTTIKAFVKVVNYSHLMVTRHTFDTKLMFPNWKKLMISPESKKKFSNELGKLFTEKYRKGDSSWLFQKLRF
ncbi:hypothetical protein SNEBB_004025 [Seison nebaliae]|nr:hypothetical protein SNEBB_004025 [Seison nebaliae]